MKRPGALPAAPPGPPPRDMWNRGILLRLSALLYSASSVLTIAVAIIAYGYFLAEVMPAQSERSATYAGPWGAPDRHFSYSPDEFYQNVAGWGAAGRADYVSFRLGLDIGWALTYTAFLVTLTSAALRRSVAPASRLRLLNLAPLVTMVSDLAENALGIWLVSDQATRLDAVVWLASSITTIKWTSLVIAHIILAVALIAALRARRSAS